MIQAADCCCGARLYLTGHPAITGAAVDQFRWAHRRHLAPTCEPQAAHPENVEAVRLNWLEAGS